MGRKKNRKNKKSQLLAAKHAEAPIPQAEQKEPPAALIRTNTMKEIQGDEPLLRTNSVHFDEKGKEERIKYSTRNYVGDYSFNEGQDGLKIAVFSRESSRSFSKAYHRKIKADNLYTLHEGKNKRSLAFNFFNQLKAKLGYSKIERHEDALPALFKNRESPHVVAILEGTRDNLKETFTLKEGVQSYDYILDKFYIEGKKSNGDQDERQNMHFYVRGNMTKAIKVSKAIIGRGKEAFSVGEIQCETETGEKYSILIPHIPSNIARKPKRANMLLEAYKNEVSEDRHVVGYIGDTNFRNAMMQPNSSPSTGGNQSKKFISPTSSGAKKHTYFMQAVFFGTPANSSFCMTQPKTLNHVDLQLGGNDKTATDHPSIQTTIVLDSVIKHKGLPA